MSAAASDVFATDAWCGATGSVMPKSSSDMICASAETVGTRHVPSGSDSSVRSTGSSGLPTVSVVPQSGILSTVAAWSPIRVGVSQTPATDTCPSSVPSTVSMVIAALVSAPAVSVASKSSQVAGASSSAAVAGKLTAAVACHLPISGSQPWPAAP